MVRRKSNRKVSVSKKAVRQSSDGTARPDTKDVAVADTAPVDVERTAQKSNDQKRRSMVAKAVGAAAVLVAASFATVGNHLGDAVYHEMLRIVDDVTGSPHTARPAPLEAYTVTTYTNSAGIALPLKLESGPAYAEILKGLSWNGAGLDWGSIVSEEHGAAAGTLHVDITFTARSESPIRIINVRIRFVARPSSNIGGTYVRIQHGGGVEPFWFTANLDSAAPVLAGIKGQASFPDFAIELSRGEQSELAIDFYAQRHTYRYVLLVDYLQNGRKRTLVVHDGSGPFMLTGISKRYMVTYVSDYPRDYGFHMAR